MFSLPDMDGKLVSLDDLQGKLVLLNFWATWCPPCVEEMPALERLYRRFKNRGFIVVAVSVDSDRAKLSEFIEDNGLTFPILHDREFKVTEDFGVDGFPESFLLDQEGKFLEIEDPVEKSTVVRIISDRPWDAPVFVKLISGLIEQAESLEEGE